MRKSVQFIILCFLSISYVLSTNGTIPKSDFVDGNQKNEGITFASGDTTNLALAATVYTSFVSSWETLTAVNNGYDPASSSDKSKGAYGNWNGESDYNTYNWVQYEWNLAQKIISTSVYWWDDGAGIDQPTNAYVEYWNGTSWILADSIGVALNQYNTLELNLRTNKVRINMVSLMATGILGWKVSGIENDSVSCDSTALIPYIQVNSGIMQQVNATVLLVGDSVHLDLQPQKTGDWSWSGPAGFNAVTREVVIRDIQTNQSGTYTACYLNDCGAYSVQYFYITVSNNPDIAASYEWPSYDPAIYYNFRDEFPSLAEPTMDLDDCPEVVGSQSSGWWTFRWGPDANSLVTTAAITPMLERMNSDFAYFRDTLGWPPDKRAKNGYRSAIYLYGSGLCTDDASNTEKGGWQSSIFYQGETTRKAHFNYRLQIVSGVTGTASVNKKWYDWTKDLATSSDSNNFSLDPESLIYPNPVKRGDNLNISFNGPQKGPIWIEIRNIQGQVVYKEKLSGNSSINTGGNFVPGAYFASVQTATHRYTQKLIIE
jgi:hypothetical protein